MLPIPDKLAGFTRRWLTYFDPDSSERSPAQSSIPWEAASIDGQQAPERLNHPCIISMLGLIANHISKTLVTDLWNQSEES